jgi:hypothetical protein
MVQYNVKLSLYKFKKNNFAVYVYEGLVTQNIWTEVYQATPQNKYFLNFILNKTLIYFILF